MPTDRFNTVLNLGNPGRSCPLALIFFHHGRRQFADIRQPEFRHAGQHVGTILGPILQHMLQPLRVEFIAHTIEWRRYSALVAHFRNGRQEKRIAVACRTTDPAPSMTAIAVERRQRLAD